MTEATFLDSTKPLVISKLSNLPQFSGLLLDGKSKWPIGLPERVLNHLCALETGVGKAALLVTDESVTWVTPYLNQLRGALIGKGFSVDAKTYLCTAGVIDRLRSDAPNEDDFADKQGQAEISESEAASLFKEWVDVAVRERATDIHVQVINNLAEVKVRIDGELEYLPDSHGGVYTPIQAERAVAWAYNNASGKGSNSNSQFSSKESLYCMIAPRDVLGKRVALRYQSVRGWAGVKVVCRLLYVNMDAPTLSYEQLGYAPSHIEQLVDASNTPSGMILFAGVTGSGKTTTLKTFVETHPENGNDAFYSIEDPVEYPLRGVHQIPVQRDLIDKAGSAAKYSEVVSALMRADPGCVLMGEIRDEATAKSAQQIVETGHMACGTVHAHLVSGIIPRLTNEEIGMSRDVLTNPNMLTLMGYQALVPVLCPHCSLKLKDLPKDQKETKRVQQICEKIERRFSLDTKNLRFKNVEGCSKCGGRGTKGLTVVAEILTPDRKWLELIREGEDYKAVMHYREKSDGRFDTDNMNGKTVFEHTLYKAYTGQIDPRNCERFDSFERFEVIESTKKEARRWI